MYPFTRTRRIRNGPRLRRMFQEQDPQPRQLVLPIFCDANLDRARPVGSMPGVMAYPFEDLAALAEEAESLGLGALLLFGIPDSKDAEGSSGWAEDGVAQKALRLLKSASDIPLIADLCLCEYTDHGHCGVWDGKSVDNDATLELYGLCAQSLAAAGADVIAPSGMMDGQVMAIRSALDDDGWSELPVMAYSAKFASPLYGPFREAACSAPQAGDRLCYQIPPGNGREGMREMLLDEEEGADALIVKPALPYLDLLAEQRRRSDIPLAAYQVSGEYAMARAAADAGWLDLHAVMDENFKAILRAGADIIISYYAMDYARRGQETIP